MEILSKEIQLEGLKSVKTAGMPGFQSISPILVELKSPNLDRIILEHVSTLVDSRLDLERALQNKTGLISSDELKRELGITEPTLNRWIKLGLKVFSPPIENSKKRYFLISDVINFLTIY